VALGLVLIIARIAYRSAGVAFMDEAVIGMQLLDTDLLRNRLLESLLNLHSQPPLFNAVVGIALKLFPENWAVALDLLQMSMGIGGAFLVAASMTRLGCNPWISVAIATILAVSPPYIIYENLLFYTHWCLFLLSLAGYGLVRSRGRAGGWMALALWALAALTMVRSLYHPLYLLLAVAALWSLVLRQDRFRLLRIAAPPVMVVGAWLAKNFLLFSFVGMSSWSGLGFQAVAKVGLPADRVLEMSRQGDLSPVSGTRRFAPPEDLIAALGLPDVPRGVPALDLTRKTPIRPGEDAAINYNHWVFPEASRAAFSDAIRMIRMDPLAFLDTVTMNARLFMGPVVLNNWVFQNRTHMPAVESRVNSITGSILAPMFLTLVLGWALMRFVRRGGDPGERMFVTFAICTILWVTMVSLVFETGENARFRYPLLGLFWVLAGLAIRDGIRWIINRLR
jgi:hypothetical protein